MTTLVYANAGTHFVAQASAAADACATLFSRNEDTCDDRRRTAPRGVAPAHQALEALGAVHCREAVGNGTRGLQSGRNGVGLFSARYGAVPRLSLGGRRHRGNLRPPSARVF